MRFWKNSKVNGEDSKLKFWSEANFKIFDSIANNMIHFNILDALIDVCFFFFFPPDIMMYENLWYGEIMLQSTFTSQLLNLGNCSALNPEECKIVHKFSPKITVKYLFKVVHFIWNAYKYTGWNKNVNDWELQNTAVTFYRNSY